MEENEKTRQEVIDEKGEDSQEYVKLTPEQYDALLEELEKAKSKQSGHDIIDELAEKGKQSEDKIDMDKVDFDSMSNAELVNYMLSLAQEHLVKPLLVQVETIRVQNEIDKCRSKHEDFDDYYQDIYKICMENPKMPIETAYKLAKMDKSEEPKKEKPVLRTLPPRPVRTHAEKPGISRSNTQMQEPRTLREAAMRAWEDVMKSNK